MQTRQHQLLNKLKIQTQKVNPLRPVASGQLVRVVGLTLEGHRVSCTCWQLMLY